MSARWSTPATPPFLVDRRVVVVREAGRIVTADVPRLVEVVKDPLPSTVLVLVGGGGTVPAPLVKAVTAAGKIIDVTTSKAGDRKAWLHEHLRGAPVKLEPAAADLLAGHVGEDLGRVEGLLGALSAAYGEGARISAEDLAPYLGEAGQRAPLPADRCHRQGRARAGAAGAAPHARCRRPRAHSGARHAARSLLQHARPRRGRRRRRARRGGDARYGALRGQEGPRAVTPPGQRPHRRGHQPHRQGRPRRARGERAQPGGRGRDPGGPAGSPDPARPTGPSPRRPAASPAYSAGPRLGAPAQESGEQNNQRWFSGSRAPYSRNP